jgi:protein-disulfide isomerase
LFVSISVALLLVAGAVWYVSQGTDEEQPAALPAAELARDPIDSIRPIQASDHVIGNPNAPVVIVVFSDFQCPYCEDHHKVMRSIMDMFGRDGNVAWVYRHFPFVDVHPESPMYALASECAASLGGNQAFWTYTEGLFNMISPDYAATPADLVALAGTVGVDRVAFASCMRNNEHMERVEEDFEEAIRAEADATPFTVIFTNEGATGIAGAQPLPEFTALVKALVDINTKDGLTAPGDSFDTSAFDSFIPPAPVEPAATSTTP